VTLTVDPDLDIH